MPASALLLGVSIASLNLCTHEYLLLLARPNEIASVTMLSRDPLESPLWREGSRHRFNSGLIEGVIPPRPDVIIMMPCGYRVEQSLAGLGPLVSQPGWSDLKAVNAGRVFVADGQYFFNRPGLRLVESAEMIAAMLAAGPSVDEGLGWVRC